MDEAKTRLHEVKDCISKTTANALTIVDEATARVASSSEELAGRLQAQSDGHGQGVAMVVAEGRSMCDEVATHSGGASAKLSGATRDTRQ